MISTKNVTVLSIILCLHFMLYQSEIILETQRWPTVFVAVLIRNKAHTLPYFFSCLHRQDYPKDRLFIWFYCDHNNDDSPGLVNKWIKTHNQEYNGVNFTLISNGHLHADETASTHWSLLRFKHVIKLREEALVLARKKWADFIFMLDADVLLTNTVLLKSLVSKQYPVVAPMLKSDGLYSNFWCSMRENYYYKRSEDYLPILNRERVGCFDVPVVHSAVLINLNLLETDKLTYDPQKIKDYDGPDDDVIAFALSSKKSNVTLKVCNDDLYGFLPVPVEDGDDPRNELDQLLNVKLEALSKGQILPLDAIFEEDVTYTTPWKYGCDQIFMINLDRRIERRNLMSRSFKELGMEVKRFVAVDGRKLDINNLHHQSIKLMPNYEDPYHKRPMKTGEIGCFLSHYYIWEEILKNGYKITLVLEDDIHFAPYFRQKFLNLLKELENFDWDLVYIGRKILVDDEVLVTRHLAKPQYSYWTLGYLLSNAGARKLLDAKPLEKMLPVDEFLPIMFDQHPNDTWKSYFEQRNLNAYSASPLLAHPTHYTGQQGYVSDTEDSHLIPPAVPSPRSDLEVGKGDVCRCGAVRGGGERDLCQCAGARAAAAMGNHHSGSHTSHKPRKNVHWKSAGRPAVPGKPEIIPLSSDEEPNAITLKWSSSVHDGGAPLQGYQVECNRLGTAAWVRTAPAVVQRPELVLTGLEPPHRYQFRVAAVNAVGRSDHSELSDVLTVSADAHHQEPPLFTQHLEEVTALENDKTEFRVSFTGSPTPMVSWFKDGYEIFSSRRTAITTEDHFSVLVFHQTLASDEGEIKCTVTNRAGHAVSKAHLSLEAAPKLRYPRQYEDGLLFEINETVFLKTAIVGKPTPSIEWRHDGQLIQVDERIQITNTPKFSILKIQSACRSDRGEYQIHARNMIGEDTAAFLVTITAPPEPPRHVSVTRQVDKSVTLTWEPPEDDGGCRIGNYIVEYYRTGWNVWLKATTSRKTNVTLFELIEGSEYRFRVKAESPYGMSAPSSESTPVKIPGRAIDMEFLAVESRIITDVLLREDGEVAPVSPVPRRRRPHPRPDVAAAPAHAAQPAQPPQRASSNEFMLLLCPNDQTNKMDTAEKRKSFQLDLEDALSPPQLSLSAPDLSSRCALLFKPLRNAVSSTELLHERAMARFYKAVALTEEQDALKQNQKNKINKTSDSSKDIPVNITKRVVENKYVDKEKPPQITVKPPEIIVKNSLNENKVADMKQNTLSNHFENKWQSISFEEDYTASTVSTDGEYSDNESFIGDLERKVLDDAEEDTYSPRDKFIRPSQDREQLDENENKKLLPSLEPKFMPKPILKRRESDTINNKVFIEEQPPKKDKKMTILKKITKMPVQKTFSKILNKKETEPQVKVEKKNESKVMERSEEKEDEIFSDEGKTAIDYYSNIVKEYGSQKKPPAQLYLNTDDLKNVAEKQQQQHLKKQITNNKEVKQQLNKKSKKANTTKSNQVKRNLATKNKSENKEIVENNKSLEQAESTNESNDKCTQKIVLRKTERATIVIPINYQELEQNAKINVRSAIDYILDLCLLILAFWAYFFKDERLAIPFLVLIIYRQLKETVFMNIPDWAQRNTPRWLKKIS